MIKINLALKKQSASGEGKGRARDDVASGGGLPKLDLNLGSLGAGASALFSEPKFRQLILGCIVVALVYVGIDRAKVEELNQLDAEIAQLTTTNNKLRAEVAKTKGYEELKKALEADELAIRTKIDTIQKLIADRQSLPKMMLGMAQLIPADVWLTDFKVANDDFTLKGFSLGYNQVSDFMRNLNESAFFTELRLSSSQAARDETGSEVAQFELGAHKRQ